MRLSLSNWFRILHDIRARKASAEREVENSSDRLAETRELVRPLAEMHERNQFSDMIRDALATGYGPSGSEKRKLS